MYRIYLAIIALCINSLGYGQEKQLVWAEEFNGSELDEKNWTIALGDGCPTLCGWGNQEKQVYTTTNHRLVNGILYIEARKNGEEYSSTRLTTKGKKKFQYGRIEIRAQLPTGKGLWPAFWLLGDNIDAVGWPLCGEIDVLEYVGRAPGEIFTTLHTQAAHGDNGNSKTTTIPGIEQGFHTYAADWNNQCIRFYVDDQEVYVFAPKEKSEEIWPFDQPFYVLLNLAIGGHFGGDDIDDNRLPQQFAVDYIRVYQ